MSRRSNHQIWYLVHRIQCDFRDIRRLRYSACDRRELVNFPWSFLLYDKLG